MSGSPFPNHSPARPVLGKAVKVTVAELADTYLKDPTEALRDFQAICEFHEFLFGDHVHWLVESPIDERPKPPEYDGRLSKVSVAEAAKFFHRAVKLALAYQAQPWSTVDCDLIERFSVPPFLMAKAAESEEGWGWLSKISALRRNCDDFGEAVRLWAIRGEPKPIADFQPEANNAKGMPLRESGSEVKRPSGWVDVGGDPKPDQSRAPDGKPPKPSLNAIALDLILKHGPAECAQWSVRDWAVNMQPQWGKLPTVSTISKLPAIFELRKTVEAAKQAMVEKQTARDETGKRRSTRF